MASNIAVIGCGYWGKNLVRNFYELGALRWICDVREETLQDLAAKYPAQTTSTVEEVLADPAVEAVAIAAPAADHFRLAMQSLAAGKHVFIEKPLALHVDDGERIVQAAHERHLQLMVGHILQYHPGILALKQLINDGELGQIKYIYSSRLNLGKVRREENILWSFAPHDISAIVFLLDELPVRVSSHSGSYVDSHIADTTMTICEFGSGVSAHIFVSWLHPYKEQKLTIVGGKKMAVFDDMEALNKLVLYSHRIDWIDRMPVAHKDSGVVVPLPATEPLQAECQHFLYCISSGRAPRTDGENGLRVLRILETCEQSVRQRGQPVELAVSKPAFFAHPTAVIDPGCEIGAGTKIWHFSHIMSGSRLGKLCNLGQNVVVSPACKIGNNVKIQNNVSVYTGVELEDDVFCGPSMVFTNVINPRSHVIRRNEYKRTLIKQGASIGANVTIVCGITLGRYAFVGAGAVVTHDVPDYALMVGVPARQDGWMCYCGIRLPRGGDVLSCPSCHRCYQLSNNQLQALPEDQKQAAVVTEPEVVAA